MSLYTPIYRPTRGQESHLDRQQILKRKRQDDGSDDEHVVDKTDVTKPSHLAESPSNSNPRPSALLATSKTDPYYIAGHSRHEPLPPPPFPHAPVKTLTTQRTVEEDLAALNLPVLFPPEGLLQPHSHGKQLIASSLKRHHIDNLTTLLHTSLLRHDWPRAHRAWSLLLRTELGGKGPDIRAHGRWGIGAELLMRSAGSGPKPTDDVGGEFTDAGFEAAREYYERLILQYPRTPRSKRGINALSFYPALFGIWVYEVQRRRSRRKPGAVEGEEEGGPVDAEERRNVARRELEDAAAIAERMDQVLANPPYDSSVPLVELRGMVGLWIADLREAVAEGGGEEEDGGIEDDGGFDAERSREVAEFARKKGLEFLRKARGMGANLPASVGRLLDQEDEDED